MAKVNAFGVPLDRNGYAPSLIQEKTDVVCWVDGCNCTEQLNRHEVFHGANRTKSKAFGCWVTLCYYHHAGIHNGQLPNIDRKLKVRCQSAYMRRYQQSVFDFIHTFGKNYI